MKDLTGQRFEKLTVIELAAVENKNKRKRAYWECVCDCGKKTIVRADALVGGRIKSCGCLLKKKVTTVKVGDVFGKLLVQKVTTSTKSGKQRTVCECICDCGNIHTIRADVLKFGGVTSCGCDDKKNKNAFCRKPYARNLYKVYQDMKQRCYNAKSINYNCYGGKGIIVCKEWLSGFAAFYEWAISHGYQAGLQIDRTDNNQNYEPSNCRWVTPKQNANNKSNSKRVLENNEWITMEEYAEKYHITTQAVRKRIKSGKVLSKQIYP